MCISSVIYWNHCFKFVRILPELLVYFIGYLTIFLELGPGMSPRNFCFTIVHEFWWLSSVIYDHFKNNFYMGGSWTPESPLIPPLINATTETRRPRCGFEGRSSTRTREAGGGWRRSDDRPVLASHPSHHLHLHHHVARNKGRDDIRAQVALQVFHAPSHHLRQIHNLIAPHR